MQSVVLYQNKYVVLYMYDTYRNAPYWSKSQNMCFSFYINCIRSVTIEDTVGEEFEHVIRIYTTYMYPNEN